MNRPVVCACRALPFVVTGATHAERLGRPGNLTGYRTARAFIILCVALMLVACSRKGVSTPSAGMPFTIVATDSGYVLPDTLHSGLNHFVYENHGREIHECMFIKLPDGMSPADYVAQVKSGVDFPAGALDCGGPGLTSPGERVEMWVPLDEGHYMIGCWLGKHLTTRKPVTFVVHGAPAVELAPPREDVIVRMTDFRYEIEGTLRSGQQTIRYETLGPSMHEADVVRMADGRTVEDVRAWFKDNERDPLPGAIGGGCMDSHDLKRVSWARRRFEPGRYVFWCDMPMIQNSEPADTTAARVTHADAGMFKEVTID